MAKQENRRLEMDTIKGLPLEVFADTVNDFDTIDVLEKINSMSRDECHAELLTLKYEKELLTTAVEYLKGRLTK